MYSYRLEDNSLPEIRMPSNEQKNTGMEQGAVPGKDWLKYGNGLFVGRNLPGRKQTGLLFKQLTQGYNITFNGCRLDPAPLKSEDGLLKLQRFLLLEFGDYQTILSQHTEDLMSLLRYKLNDAFRNTGAAVDLPEVSYEYYGSPGDINFKVCIERAKLNRFVVSEVTEQKNSPKDLREVMRYFTAHYEERYHLSSTLQQLDLEYKERKKDFPGITKTNEKFYDSRARGYVGYLKGKIGYSLKEIRTDSSLLREVLHYSNMSRLLEWRRFNSAYIRETFNEIIPENPAPVNPTVIKRGLFWEQTLNPLNLLIIFTEYAPQLAKDGFIHLGQISPAAACVMSPLYLIFYFLWKFTFSPITSPAMTVREDFSYLINKPDVSAKVFIADSLPLNLIVFAARMALLSSVLYAFSDFLFLQLLAATTGYTLGFAALCEYITNYDAWEQSRPTLSRAQICGLDVIEEPGVTLLGFPFYLLKELAKGCLYPCVYKRSEYDEVAESITSSWQWGWFEMVSAYFRIPLNYLHPNLASLPTSKRFSGDTIEEQKVSTHIKRSRKKRLEAEKLKRQGDDKEACMLSEDAHNEIVIANSLALSQSMLGMSAIFVFGFLPRFLYNLTQDGPSTMLVVTDFLLPIPALAFMGVIYQNVIFGREESNLGPEVDYATLPSNLFAKTTLVTTPDKSNAGLSVRAFEKLMRDVIRKNESQFDKALTQLIEEKDPEVRSSLIHTINKLTKEKIKLYLSRQPKDKSEIISFEHRDGWRLVRRFKDLLRHEVHTDDRFSCFPARNSNTNVGRCYGKAIEELQEETRLNVSETQQAAGPLAP